MIFDDDYVRYEDKPITLKFNPKTKETMQEVHLLNAHNTYTGTFLGRFLPKELVISNDIDVKNMRGDNLVVNHLLANDISAHSGTFDQTTFNYPILNNPTIIVDGKEIGSLVFGDLDAVTSALFDTHRNRISVEQFIVLSSLVDDEIAFRDPGVYDINEISSGLYIVQGPSTYETETSSKYSDISVMISGDILDISSCVVWAQIRKCVDKCCKCCSSCKKTTITTVCSDIEVEDITDKRVKLNIVGNDQPIYIDYGIEIIREPKLEISSNYEDYILTIYQGKDLKLCADFTEISDLIVDVNTLSNEFINEKEHVNSKLKLIDDNISSLSNDVKNNSNAIDAVNKYIESLDNELDELSNKTDRRFNNIDNKLVSISKEISSINKINAEQLLDIDIHDTKITLLDGLTENIQRDIKSISSSIIRKDDPIDLLSNNVGYTTKNNFGLTLSGTVVNIEYDKEHIASVDLKTIAAKTSGNPVVSAYVIGTDLYIELLSGDVIGTSLNSILDYAYDYTDSSIIDLARMDDVKSYVDNTLTAYTNKSNFSASLDGTTLNLNYNGDVIASTECSSLIAKGGGDPVVEAYLSGGTTLNIRLSSNTVIQAELDSILTSANAYTDNVVDDLDIIEMNDVTSYVDNVLTSYYNKTQVDYAYGKVTVDISQVKESLSNYASKQSLTKIESEIADVKSDVLKNSKDINDLKGRVGITSADVSSIVELYGYATEDWVDEQGFIKEHQSLDEYAKQSWVKELNYLTSHQDLDDYAEKSWVESKNYLTSHQSLTGYATEEWVELLGYLTSHQNLDEYVTHDWIEQLNYLTSHQLLTAYTLISGFSADLDGTTLNLYYDGLVVASAECSSLAAKCGGDPLRRGELVGNVLHLYLSSGTDISVGFESLQPSLTAYSTTDEMVEFVDSELTGYYTKSEVNDIVSEYATNDRVSVVENSLTAYLTESDITAFATNERVDLIENGLTAYVKNEDIEKYATRSELTAYITLNDLTAYSTKDDLDQLERDLTSYVDSTISTKSEIVITQSDYTTSYHKDILSVGYISLSTYAEKCRTHDITDSLYLVSCDNFTVFGERVVDMADPIDQTDGVSLGYLSSKMEYDYLILKDLTVPGDKYKLVIRNGNLIYEKV